MFDFGVNAEDIHKTLLESFGDIGIGTYEVLLAELKRESMFALYEIDSGSASNEGFEFVNYDEKTMSKWDGVDVVKLVKKMYAGRLSIRQYEIGMVEIVVDDVEVAFATNGLVGETALPYACYKAIYLETDKKLVMDTVAMIKNGGKKVEKKKPEIVVKEKKFYKTSVADIDEMAVLKKRDDVAFINYDVDVHKLYGDKNTLMIINERRFPCTIKFNNRTLSTTRSECDMVIDGVHCATGVATRVQEAKAAVVHDFLTKIDGGVTVKEMIGVDIDKGEKKVDDEDKKMNDLKNLFDLMGFPKDKYNYAMQGMLKFHNDVVDLITLFSTRLKFNGTVQELMAKIVNRDYLITVLRSYDIKMDERGKNEFINKFYTDYVFDTNFKRFSHVAVATTLSRLGVLKDGYDDDGSSMVGFTKKKNSKMRVKNGAKFGGDYVRVYNGHVYRYAVFSDTGEGDDDDDDEDY